LVDVAPPRPSAETVGVRTPEHEVVGPVGEPEHEVVGPVGEPEHEVVGPVEEPEHEVVGPVEEPEHEPAGARLGPGVTVPSRSGLYGDAVEIRTLGRTGREVGVIGLGCWQLGADWGHVEERDALAILDAAVNAGASLFDTADVYGDGRSEQLIARFRAVRPDVEVMVATKAGRRADPHVADAFTAANLRAWVDRSRTNLRMDTLDLLQLHCPPPEVYARDAVFDALDDLVAASAIAAYGVSVETCEQALAAIARPHVATIQIILNAFRLKPLDAVLPAAREAGVGIIARVPLASGLLSGRYDASTTFAADDHRTYNRHGEAFDVGETFSGVPFEIGVDAARELSTVVPAGVSMAAFALRWVVDQPGVSVVIPGARTARQSRFNAEAVELPPLTAEQLDGVRRVYDSRIREHVHDRW
ncbi:MAG: aldo/keto reductase, partial [Kineosporiaceae bacterium]